MNNVLKTVLVTCAILGFQHAQAEQQAPALKADFFNVGAIETVKEVAPDYPRLAVRSGVEGYVVLSYNLDANGKPVDIAVVEAQPKRVFNESAIRALKASRFAVIDAEGTSYAIEGLARRYDFQFPEGAKTNRTARR